MTRREMTPEERVAFNHLRDFVKYNAPIIRPKLERSLGVIQAALERTASSGRRLDEQV